MSGVLLVLAFASWRSRCYRLADDCQPGAERGNEPAAPVSCAAKPLDASVPIVPRAHPVTSSWSRCSQTSSGTPL
jgi:hypothetical protein